MPDFERLTDDLREQLAEEEAEERGFTRGKTYARLEMLMVFTVLAVIGLSIYWLLSGGIHAASR